MHTFTDLQSKYRLINLKTQTSDMLLNTVVLDIRSKCNNLDWKTQLKLDSESEYMKEL